MEKDKQQYVEEFALFAEQEVGLGATIGRVLAWMLVCEPPQQTLDEICEALDMSKSTISTTVRLMSQFGMIERVSVRGDRRHFYQMNQGFWTQRFDQALHEFARFNEMAEKGLALLADADPKDRERLENMQALYQFLTKEFPPLIDKWKQSRTDDKSSKQD
jgi:DNA-binding transcriptional regulator GbsR (MarR family)